MREGSLKDTMCHHPRNVGRRPATQVGREVNAVVSEYSRNTNSDARKRLQLRRSNGEPPYSGFSTGNAATLSEAPAAANICVPTALRRLWQRRYVADALTVALVGPQPMDELEAVVRRCFSDVRPGAPQDDDGPRAALAVPGFTPWAPTACGKLFRIVPERTLRQVRGAAPLG